MEVREATAEDVEAVRRVHAAAIAELAATAYSDRQIEAWQEPVASAEYAAIEADEHHFVVAEVDGTVVGFGSLRRASPDGYQADVDGEVTAVYVHPEWSREGVGSELLAELEREARDADLRSLGLEASVNAVPFYEHHGYERVREVVHEFGGRVEGPAVEMRTRL